MSALSLVLVVGFVVLVVALSPRLIAWFRNDSPSESLRIELEALERKKELLRQLQRGGGEPPGIRQPPAA